MSNRSLVLYGSTSTFKTTACGMIAKYIYETTGKVSRYIYADGGSWSHISSLAKAGIIEPLVIVDDPNPKELMRGIIHNKMWPTNLGKDYKRTGASATCDIDHVGAYIIEGLTSLSELIHNTYRGKTTAMKAAYGEKITPVLKVEGSREPNLSWETGSLSQDSYGLVQSEMMELLLKSWVLPVDLVMWTGHEAQGKDERSQRPIRGVALVGQAGTPRLGKKVGDLIHAIQMPKEKGSMEMITRYYYMNHPDPNFPDIPWEAKPRVPASQIDKLRAKFPGGFFEPKPDKGLDEFLRFEDTLMNADDEVTKKWKEEIDKKRSK